MPKEKGSEKRCTNCGKLLLKGHIGEGGKVEVKCQCGTLNTFEINQDGRSFQDRIYINRKYNDSHVG